MEARILRRREVERLTLLSRASIYHQMRMGTFPRPLKLGCRAVSPGAPTRFMTGSQIARARQAACPVAGTLNECQARADWGAAVMRAESDTSALVVSREISRIPGREPPELCWSGESRLEDRTGWLRRRGSGDFGA